MCMCCANSCACVVQIHVHVHVTVSVFFFHFFLNFAGTLHELSSIKDDHGAIFWLHLAMIDSV